MHSKKTNVSRIPVSQYTELGEKIATYPSQAEASRRTGINRGNIWSSANFVRYKAGGYVWRYAT